MDMEPRACTPTSPQPVSTGKVHRQGGAPKEQKRNSLPLRFSGLLLMYHLCPQLILFCDSPGWLSASAHELWCSSRLGSCCPHL